jgi:hypothetical protein
MVEIEFRFRLHTFNIYIFIFKFVIEVGNKYDPRTLDCLVEHLETCSFYQLIIFLKYFIPKLKYSISEYLKNKQIKLVPFRRYIFYTLIFIVFT